MEKYFVKVVSRWTAEEQKQNAARFLKTEPRMVTRHESAVRGALGAGIFEGLLMRSVRRNS
jgi:hypothetical protein